MTNNDDFTSINLPRRRFVKGVAAGGALLGLELSPARLLAAINTSPARQQALSGRKFHLTLAPQAVNFTGHPATATAINGTVPGPILRFREGDTVAIDVTNKLAESTSLHWHGIILPAPMDGVPDISYKGIDPGETFHYQFQLKQSGTYWYHSHSGFQEQTGHYGPLIVEPKEPEPFAYDRDYVVMLSDWSDEDPVTIYAKLKKMSDYYNFAERTVFDLENDIKQQGLTATWRKRAMWNRMRMSDRDLSDVTGYTYTFLMNGIPPAQSWTGLFKRGEKVRLRVINGSAMTFFDFRIPGLSMTVVAADGQNIEPVTVDEFRIGVAETYDVIVEPQEQPYTLFAQALDRTGYACGALTPDPSLKAEIPDFDPYPILTHQDMGMAMPGHKMSAMSHNIKRGPAGLGSDTPVIHAMSEYGPQVDARAKNPQYRLDDPGAGLRNNGRRILTYADLRNLYPTSDTREPGREIQLHLTGNMARYMWSINGIKYADAEPLHFKYGERLRITFINDTMMNHPMHLHGMWSELETGDGRRMPQKHTVTVQPGARISYLVTADAMGGWAFHCHLLYHMLGMFRKVIVA
ncbi:MAG: copper resistance system multicopper oxidase [Deltaproteobacteria bacterium]|nr:copper resistance system multicopper oxidase [Deltaproteobacteria bacterium]